MSDSFTCAECGGTFGKGWSDEEGQAEARRNGFDPDAHDMVVVCDPCYMAMTAAIPETIVPAPPGFQWMRDERDDHWELHRIGYTPAVLWVPDALLADSAAVHSQLAAAVAQATEIKMRLTENGRCYVEDLLSTDEEST